MNETKPNRLSVVTLDACLKQNNEAILRWSVNFWKKDNERRNRFPKKNNKLAKRMC